MLPLLKIFQMYSQLNIFHQLPQSVLGRQLLLLSNHQPRRSFENGMHPCNYTTEGVVLSLPTNCLINLNKHPLVICCVLMLFYLQVHDQSEVTDSQLLFSYLLFGQSLHHHLALCDDVYTGRLVRKWSRGVRIQETEDRQY